jgi:hypothetical protein
VQLSKIKRHISNIPGWRTGRKLLVIESDDWGSIRMPNNEARNRLLKKGVITEGNRYNRYDTLATIDDLNSLFGVLKKYKDCKENSAVFTPVTITGNPDFEGVEKNEFQQYFCEPFTDTLQRYYSNHEEIYSLWKEGIDAGIFCPQFHGREHLNVAEWLRLLQKDDEVTRTAFQEGCWGFDLSKSKYSRINSLQAAFDLYDMSEIANQAETIEEGLNMFETLFGYRATFFVPPNGPFNNSLEKTAAECGIRYMSKAKRQTEPLGEGKTRTVYHKPGSRNEHGQIILTRNCIFEPSEEGKDWVDSCISDIKIAFRMRKPAVISTHRVNYIGALDESNRKRGLLQLDLLLKKIVKEWPEVEFITSEQLGDIIKKDNYSSGQQ